MSQECRENKMAIIEIDQRIDSPVSTFFSKNISLRYAYKRKLDAKDDSGYRGEDYLVVRSEEAKTVFALCDGVASSFFGALGSQLLGEALVDWLWYSFADSTLTPTDGDVESKALAEFLNANTEIGKELTSQKDISSNNIYLARELKERKEAHGTQSNFVCGVINYPKEKVEAGYVYLFWLGDAKLRLFKGKQENTELLNATWDSSEAWSSIHGVVGNIHSRFLSTNDVDHIIAHSDGANPVEQNLQPSNNNGQLDKLLAQAQEIKDDDVSYLEISFRKKIEENNDEINYFLRDYHQAQRELSQVQDHSSNQYIMSSTPEENREPTKTDTNKPTRTRKVFQYLLALLVVLNIILAGLMFKFQKDIAEISQTLNQMIDYPVPTSVYSPVIKITVIAQIKKVPN